MGLICQMFGHRPAFGYGNVEGNGYFQVALSVVDGIGRMHANLLCNCERCGENYQVGKIHIPADEAIKKADFYGEKK